MILSSPPAVSGRLWAVSRDTGSLDNLREASERLGCELFAFDDSRAFLEAYVPHPPECLLLDGELSRAEVGGILELHRERGHLIPLIGLGNVPHDAGGASTLSFMVDAAGRKETRGVERWIEAALAWSRVYQGDLQRARESSERLGRLTDRERDVLGLVLEGLPSKEIGYRLGIARKTVDVHRAHLGHKLGTSSLASLLRLGLDAARLDDLEALSGLNLFVSWCPVD